MIRFAVMMLLAPLWAAAGEAVIDADTGALIAGYEAEAPRPPASVTKLMTVIVALDAAAAGEASLDAHVTVSAHAAGAPPVRLGLRTGERITLGEAIHAALTRSSNDAARVIAEAVAGDEAAFARRMTRRGRELGLTATRFLNASGLPQPGHVSTALDMARLVAAADRLHGPILRKLFRAPLQWHGRRLRPRNSAVAGVRGAILGKTGFTCASGYTAAVLVNRGGVRRAFSTAGHPLRTGRARAIARLAGGVAAGHKAQPACPGAPPPLPAPRALEGYALTLGVFDDDASAIAALARAAARPDEATLGRREGRPGVYALLLADNRPNAEAARARLARAGLAANLIDRAGGRLLRLKLDPPGQGGG